MNEPKKETLVAGVPLGGIILRRFTDDPDLVMLRGGTAPVAERFRRLATILDSANDGGPVEVVVITSPAPAEGKTFTAINLAMALAESQDRRTLFIDGDLRRPAVGRYLTPPPKLGLSEVLSGDAPLEHALMQVKGSHLVILPPGSRTDRPLELLRRDYLRSLCEALRRSFDRVVIDTPPVVPFSDATVFGSHADGALLVVRAASTTKAMVERAVDALESTRVFGAVLNDVHTTIIDRYYYGYDDYNPDRYADRSEEKDGDS